MSRWLVLFAVAPLLSSCGAVSLQLTFENLGLDNVHLIASEFESKARGNRVEPGGFRVSSHQFDLEGFDGWAFAVQAHRGESLLASTTCPRVAYEEVDDWELHVVFTEDAGPALTCSKRAR